MTPLDPATRARLRESCIEVVTRGMGRVDPVAVIDVLDILDDREAKIAKAEAELTALKSAQPKRCQTRGCNGYAHSGETLCPYCDELERRTR